MKIKGQQRLASLERGTRPAKGFKTWRCFENSQEHPDLFACGAELLPEAEIVQRYSQSNRLAFIYKTFGDPDTDLDTND